MIRSDGIRESVVLSSVAVQMIGDVLQKISEADRMALLAEDAEISPEDGAAILGI